MGKPCYIHVLAQIELKIMHGAVMLKPLYESPRLKFFKSTKIQVSAQNNQYSQPQGSKSHIDLISH